MILNNHKLLIKTAKVLELYFEDKLHLLGYAGFLSQILLTSKMIKRLHIKICSISAVLLLHIRNCKKYVLECHENTYFPDSWELFK